VAEVVVAVEEVAHISGNSQHTNAAAAPTTSTPAPPPPGYVQPPHSSHCSGVLQGHLILLCHRHPNRWIYDTGCTAHNTYLRETFHSLVAHDEPMYSANGARMTIGGLGTAGPFLMCSFFWTCESTYSPRNKPCAMVPELRCHPMLRLLLWCYLPIAP
jgi:hypothetical protein